MINKSGQSLDFRLLQTEDRWLVSCQSLKLDFDPGLDTGQSKTGLHYKNVAQSRALIAFHSRKQ